MFPFKEEEGKKPRAEGETKDWPKKENPHSKTRDENHKSADWEPSYKYFSRRHSDLAEFISKASLTAD